MEWNDLVFYFNHNQVVVKEPKQFAQNFAEANNNFKIDEDGTFDLNSFENFINAIFDIEYVDFVKEWSYAEERWFKHKRGYTLKDILDGRTLTTLRVVNIIKYITKVMTEFAEKEDNENESI